MDAVQRTSTQRSEHTCGWDERCVCPKGAHNECQPQPAFIVSPFWTRTPLIPTTGVLSRCCQVLRRHTAPGHHCGLERIHVQRPSGLAAATARQLETAPVCLPARPRPCPCPAAGVFSVLAVILGQLPGDWGFFGAYLTGGVVLAVLAVGSTAPGLLQGIIDKFSQLWPDYKERVVAHEAAHLLIGECLGAAAHRCGAVCGRRAWAGGREGAQQRIGPKRLGCRQVAQCGGLGVPRT